MLCANCVPTAVYGGCGCLCGGCDVHDYNTDQVKTDTLKLVKTPFLGAASPLALGPPPDPVDQSPVLRPFGRGAGRGVSPQPRSPFTSRPSDTGLPLVSSGTPLEQLAAIRTLLKQEPTGSKGRAALLDLHAQQERKLQAQLEKEGLSYDSLVVKEGLQRLESARRPILPSHYGYAPPSAPRTKHPWMKQGMTRTNLKFLAKLTKTTSKDIEPHIHFFLENKTRRLLPDRQ